MIPETLHAFLDELEKIAGHFEDRIRQRAPDIDPAVAKPLEEMASKLQLPPGRYYHPVKGPEGNVSGYAMFKTVGKKNRLVLATFYTPDMIGKKSGSPLPIPIGMKAKKKDPASRPGPSGATWGGRSPSTTRATSLGASLARPARAA